MELLVVLPLLLVVGTGIATLLVGRWPRLQVGLSLAGVLGYAGSVAALSWEVVLAPDAPGAVAYQVGDWSAPYGITLVADGLSAFMLAMTAVVAVAALAFSTRSIDPAGRRAFYHPLFHFLLLGVTGTFLTGDLFNLFVWFEVLLMASYVFVAFYGGPAETRAATIFFSLNLVASAVMLVAIGGLYATTGTLNMADMARRLADPAAYGVAAGPAVGLAGLLLAVFALKAGLVPFHTWVPSAYAAAPAPVTAMFVGATKKVGVYAIVRLYFTVLSEADVTVAFPGLSGESPLAVLGPVLLVMAAASIVLGGLGALQAETVEELLAYSSIGQVGFIAVPVAVAATTTSSAVRHAAILAALVFALHHALAKGALFLVAGTIRDATGTSRLSHLGDLAGRFPLLSAAFLVGALALVGIPPLSGFFGKFLLFDALAREGAVVSLALVLGGSVLTIAYTTRAWTTSFWGERSPPVRGAAVDRGELAVVAALGLAVVVVGVGFEPVYEFADAAASAALDTDGYVDVVDPEGGETS